MFSEQLLTVGGQSINVAAGPANGAPFLILHGIPNRWQGMYALMAPLEARWILACDCGATENLDALLLTERWTTFPTSPQ